MFSANGSSGDLKLEQRWLVVANEVFELFKKKQKDYGPHNIGLTRDAGIVTRITDKVMRLRTLYEHNGDTAFQQESVDDTWADIADYGIIALMCRRGLWPTTTIPYQSIPLSQESYRTLKTAISDSLASFNDQIVGCKSCLGTGDIEMPRTDSTFVYQPCPECKPWRQAEKELRSALDILKTQESLNA